MAGKSIKKIARKRIAKGVMSLTLKERKMLVQAGGGGFTPGTRKKTRKLAKK